LDNCTFIDSYAFADTSSLEAGSGAGAIGAYTIDPWSGNDKAQNNVTISNSRFINCSSRVYGGGAIDFFCRDGKLENLTFIIFPLLLEDHSVYPIKILKRIILHSLIPLL
jgi:hypothetical protein